MTPKQLEAAARELCRLRGMDPDAQSSQTNKPGPDGSVVDSIWYCPAWMNATDEITAALQMQQAIAAGLAVKEQESAT